MTTLAMFTANTDLKQSRLRHELHFLKKGSLLIRDYVAKLKGICAFLDASGSPILATEQTTVLLADLSAEFETVVSSVSLSLTPLPFQCLVDALVECESRQVQAIQEVVYAGNLVEDSSTTAMDGSTCGGRFISSGRGRSFQTRL